MIADASPLAVAMTALINLAFAIIAGTLAARLWQRAAGGETPTWRGMPLAWLAVAAGASVLLLDQASQLAETPLYASWDAVGMLVAQTFSGKAAAAVAGLSLAAALISWRHLSTAPALACFAVVTAIRSTMGHAGEAGVLSLPVLVEWIHLLAMSLWVGCVIVSGWQVLPLLRNAGRTAHVADGYVQRLSSWATVALVLIALTGVFNTDRVLEHYTDLFDTAYGNLLLAKIILVAIAVALGGYNRLRGMPALTRDPDRGLRSFILVLKTESFVLAAVVLLAAVLTNVSSHG